MRKPQDYLGLTFGRLKVASISHRDKGSNLWVVCVCDCGTTKTVATSQLVQEKTRSCGCLAREATILRKTKHGASRSPLYPVWRNMMWRCYDRGCPAFPNYGGRGITVDTRWHQIEVFISDMLPRPRGGTLERVNNDGPYSKENCIWASRKQQCRNTRKNFLIEIDGQIKPLAEWAEAFGINYQTAYSRISDGWEPRDAVRVPKNLRPGARIRP